MLSVARDIKNTLEKDCFDKRSPTKFGSGIKELKVFQRSELSEECSVALSKQEQQNAGTMLDDLPFPVFRWR